MKASKKTVVISESELNSIFDDATSTTKATSKSDTLSMYDMISKGNNTYNELLLYARSQVYARASKQTTNSIKKLKQYKLESLVGQFNDLATFKAVVQSGTHNITIEGVRGYVKANEKRAKNIIKYALDYIPSETRLTNVWYNESEYKQVTKYNAKSDSYDLIDR